MPSRKKKLNHFVVMWDRLGLECVFDANAAFNERENWEKMRVISILKEEKHSPEPRGIPIQMMILRAKVNSQRAYEIYEFTTRFTMDEIKDMFKECPQAIVDAIRNVGYKIYSDRETAPWVIQ